nr:hypothetical protein CFP56_65838 [Quercus suber]
MGRVFQFESMWLKDPRCEAIVEDAWDDGLLGGSDDVLNKCLESCRARLEVWNGSEFGNVGKTVAELQKKLEWRAKDLWSSSKLVFPNIMDRLSPFKEMVWCLLMDEKSSPESLELLLTCKWVLWGNQNEVRCGEKRKDGRMLLHWVTQYLEEYRSVMVLSPVTNTSVSHVQRWNPPPTSCFKCNVDADMKSVGIGVIVRDWHGHFVAAMCKKLHAPLGPLEAELKAVEVGMQFAKQLGLSDIIMEGDSLMVYRALN